MTEPSDPRPRKGDPVQAMWLGKDPTMGAEPGPQSARTLDYASSINTASDKRSERASVAIQIFMGLFTLPLIALFGYIVAQVWAFLYTLRYQPVRNYNPIDPSMFQTAFVIGCLLGFVLAVALAVKNRWKAYVPAMLLGAGLLVSCPIILVGVICGGWIR
ncbi:MAG: hypothetical protein JWM57_885 [Phycisphaerales bacterium]|nr:hypothetical protein [Phycisphaerales bacterium]